MRDHTSLAQCKIEMKIVGLLRIQSISCFWFLLNQGKLSILCSRIQDCMLSLMNKIDPCVASPTCYAWDGKLCFRTLKTYILGW